MIAYWWTALRALLRGRNTNRTRRVVHGHPAGPYRRSN